MSISSLHNFRKGMWTHAINDLQESQKNSLINSSILLPLKRYFEVERYGFVQNKITDLPTEDPVIPATLNKIALGFLIDTSFSLFLFAEDVNRCALGIILSPGIFFQCRAFNTFYYEHLSHPTTYLLITLISTIAMPLILIVEITYLASK